MPLWAGLLFALGVVVLVLMVLRAGVSVLLKGSAAFVVLVVVYLLAAPLLPGLPPFSLETLVSIAVGLVVMFLLIDSLFSL